MLGVWRSHAEYQAFMLEKLKLEFQRNPKSVERFEKSILKLYILNLDSVKADFAPRFSATGKPSNQQPELFRSFVLMRDQHLGDIDKWVATASASPLFCALVGVEPWNFPGASTHRDFITRLWLADKPDRVKPVTKKPKESYGDQKMPPKNPGIIKKLVDKALNGKHSRTSPKLCSKSCSLKPQSSRQ